MAEDLPSTASGTPEEEAMTPKLRRRLHECYEQGTKLMTQEKYDFNYANSFLVQCVVHDPGNVVYLDAFFGNLHRKFNNNKRGSLLGFGSRGPVKKALAKQDWSQVLKLSAEVFRTNPWDVPTLRAAAEACAALGHWETELRYLKNALEVNPKDADVNRHCALSLARMGRFDQSISCWTRVDEAKRGDEEAQRMISELQIAKTRGVAWEDSQAASHTKPVKRKETPATRTPAETLPARREIRLSPRQELERAVANNPSDVETYFQLADLHMAEDRLGEAAHVLNKAVAASGGDPRARERVEDLEVRRKQQQIAVAEQRAGDGSDPAAQELVAQLKNELDRYELAIYSTRAERYPQNHEVKFQLGLRLKRLGNFREAIGCFSDAMKAADLHARASLEKGECLQRAKRYEQALECYLQAVNSSSSLDHLELHKLARYRSGVLASGLQNLATAEEQLAALVELDSGYKDARPRLDKLREIRHKG